MSDIERRFSKMVEAVAQPEIEDWVSRSWKMARDYLSGIGESPSDAVLDVVGLLLDEAEEQQAEIERLANDLAKEAGRLETVAQERDDCRQLLREAVEYHEQFWDEFLKYEYPELLSEEWYKAAKKAARAGGGDD